MSIADKLRARSQTQVGEELSGSSPISFPDGVVTDSQRQAYLRGVAEAKAAQQTAVEAAG